MKLIRLLMVVVMVILLSPLILIEWATLFVTSVVWHIRKLQPFKETWRDLAIIRIHDDIMLKNFVETGKTFHED